MPIRCEDCEAVLVAGQCVVCGWRPQSTQKPKPSSTQVGWKQQSAQSRERVQAMIAEVISKLGDMEPAAKPEQFGPGSAADTVQAHVRCFRELGLSEQAAHMQAMSMVRDAEHRRWCDICQRKTGQ